MFCTKCGAAVPSSAKFCTGCGNQVAPPSPGDASTAPRPSQFVSPGASVATGADVAGRTPLNSVPISQLSKTFKITLLCVLGGPLWLLALFATLGGHDFSIKMWGLVFLLGLSAIIYFLVRLIQNSSVHVAATSVPKVHLSSWQLIQSIGGLAVAGFFVWHLNSGPSVAGAGVGNSAPTAEASQRAAESAIPATASTTPVRTYYTVVAGAPLCFDFKGAITAASVMRSNNPMAIDAVLTRQGCQTASQRIEIDPDASIQQLGAGIVVVNTPSGDRVYTTQDSISTSRH